MNDTLSLTALPRELTNHTGGQAPSYRRLYGLTLDGVLPGEQVNGRWTFRRSDLPLIAEKLGLTPRADAMAA